MTALSVMTEHPSEQLPGTGMLIIWSDVEPADEADFNAWYTHQHLAERVGVPGFLRGRRFVRSAAAGQGQRYLTVYETRDLAVLASAGYLERLNDPTGQTRAMLPKFRNGVRAALAVAWSAGAATGRYLTSVSFSGGDRDAITGWLASGAGARALSSPDLVGLHLLFADDATTRAKDGTAESGGRRSAPGPGGVLLADGVFDPEPHVRALVSGPGGLAARGARDIRVIPYEFFAERVAGLS